MKGANASSQRKALGRGLSALMTSTEINVAVEPDMEVKTKPALKKFEDEKPKAKVVETSRSKITFEEPAVVQSSAAEEKLASAISREIEKGSLIRRGVVDKPKPEESKLEPTTIAQSQQVEGLAYVELKQLIANPSQPRTVFKEEDIKSLANSIKQSGLIQPILVRPSNVAKGSFEIVAGERRYRAAKAASLSKVPVIIRELSDKETFQVAIVENVQRADLNIIEEAKAYQRLIQEFGDTQEDVAQSVGKDRTSIANALRLLKLAPEIQSLLVDEKISAGHGRALLMASSQNEQLAIAKRILNDKLSVRETEKIARVGLEMSDDEKRRKTAQTLKSKSPQIAAIEERMRKYLGTKVELSLNEKKGSGDVHISFYSKDELESIIEKLTQ